MPCKSILVHADRTASTASRLRLSAALARRHASHIIGLAVRPMLMPPIGFVEVVPQDVIDTFSEQSDQILEELRQAFEMAAQSAGLEGQSEWRTVSGDPARQIALHGRYSDLIVVGQPNPDTESGFATELPDDVVLESGRPVLVVPYTYSGDEAGQRIMVAWNASREAARAVSDAMPFFAAAQSVEIISADPSDLGDLPGADIARHLARHGVNVEVSHTVTDGVSIGNEILNRISDHGSDMLVMGAYGHSRFRETILGGATRHILRHMTVPTLLSH